MKEHYFEGGGDRMSSTDYVSQVLKRLSSEQREDCDRLMGELGFEPDVYPDISTVDGAMHKLHTVLCSYLKGSSIQHPHAMAKDRICHSWDMFCRSGQKGSFLIFIGAIKALVYTHVECRDSDKDRDERPEETREDRAKRFKEMKKHRAERFKEMFAEVSDKISSIDVNPSPVRFTKVAPSSDDGSVAQQGEHGRAFREIVRHHVGRYPDGEWPSPGIIIKSLEDGGLLWKTIRNRSRKIPSDIVGPNKYLLTKAREAIAHIVDEDDVRNVCIEIARLVILEHIRAHGISNTGRRQKHFQGSAERVWEIAHSFKGDETQRSGDTGSKEDESSSEGSVSDEDDSQNPSPEDAKVVSEEVTPDVGVEEEEDEKVLSTIGGDARMTLTHGSEPRNEVPQIIEGRYVVRDMETVVSRILGGLVFHDHRERWDSSIIGTAHRAKESSLIRMVDNGLSDVLKEAFEEDISDGREGQMAEIFIRELVYRGEVSTKDTPGRNKEMAEYLELIRTGKLDITKVVRESPVAEVSDPEEDPEDTETQVAGLIVSDDESDSKDEPDPEDDPEEDPDEEDPGRESGEQSDAEDLDESDPEEATSVVATYAQLGGTYAKFLSLNLGDIRRRLHSMGIPEDRSLDLDLLREGCVWLEGFVYMTLQNGGTNKPERNGCLKSSRVVFGAMNKALASLPEGTSPEHCETLLNFVMLIHIEIKQATNPRTAARSELIRVRSGQISELGDMISQGKSVEKDVVATVGTQESVTTGGTKPQGAETSEDEPEVDRAPDVEASGPASDPEDTETQVAGLAVSDDESDSKDEPDPGEDIVSSGEPTGEEDPDDDDSDDEPDPEEDPAGSGESQGGETPEDEPEVGSDPVAEVIINLKALAERKGLTRGEILGSLYHSLARRSSKKGQQDCCTLYAPIKRHIESLLDLYSDMMGDEKFWKALTAATEEAFRAKSEGYSQSVRKEKAQEVNNQISLLVTGSATLDLGDKEGVAGSGGDQSVATSDSKPPDADVSESEDDPEKNPAGSREPQGGETPEDEPEEQLGAEGSDDDSTVESDPDADVSVSEDDPEGSDSSDSSSKGELGSDDGESDSPGDDGLNLDTSLVTGDATGYAVLFLCGGCRSVLDLGTMKEEQLLVIVDKDVANGQRPRIIKCPCCPKYHDLDSAVNKVATILS